MLKNCAQQNKYKTLFLIL